MFRVLHNLYSCLVDFSRTFLICLKREKNKGLLDIKDLEHELVHKKTLFQTHETSLQEWWLYCTSAQTVHMNWDYGFQFFTAQERREFIAENYGIGSRILKAYDMLKDGAYKSDIFRLCILFLKGGIYMDCKSATISPFRDFIPADTDFAMFIDTDDSRLSNGFIASSKNNRLIELLIEEATARVLAKKYGRNTLDIAGPEMFGKVVREFLGIDKLSVGRYVIDGLVVDLIGTTRLFDSFMCVNEKPVIKRQPDTYFFSANRLLKRYEISWLMRKSFKDF